MSRMSVLSVTRSRKKLFSVTFLSRPFTISVFLNCFRNRTMKVFPEPPEDSSSSVILFSIIHIPHALERLLWEWSR